MRWIILGFALHLLSAPIARADEFRFSGGQPMTAYQPRIIVPLLREAFKRVGHSFTAIHYPSLRSLKSSNSGKSDGELHRVYDFHRVSRGKYPNLVRIESELLRIATGVFSTNKNALIGSLQDLSGRRIAIKRGRQNLSRKVEKLSSSTDVFKVSSDLAAMRMLSKGHIEFALMGFNEGNAIIGNDPKFNNLHSVARLKELRIFAYMHKSHGKIAEKIALALEKMKSEGLFRDIVARSVANFAKSIKSTSTIPDK